MAETLGVIVAGGRGRRLGGAVPKALARWDGGTLLDRALAIAREACDEIVVAAPSGFDLPIDPAMRVDDVEGARGPLAGIVAGLHARPHARAIVLAVDVPLLRGATLRFLIDRLGEGAAAVPAPEGIPQPLAAAYGPGAKLALARRLAAGERSVTAAVAALEPRIVGDDELGRLAGGAAQFLNVNTPEDLSTAERRFAEERA